MIKRFVDMFSENNALLDKNKGFSRNGALLNEEDKLKLREIDTELAKIKLTYGENFWLKQYQLHITNENDLKVYRMALEKWPQVWQNQKIWKAGFSLDFRVTFVTYVDNRELRKEIAIAAEKIISRQRIDNKERKTILLNCHKRANLLGYKSHSDFVLEERMAQNPEKNYCFK
jgi:peptidyl-dipeptidase Dcp